jgi:ribose transport system permease protein
MRRLLNAQQSGLALVILLLGAVLTALAGSHPDPATGRAVNNFLNARVLMTAATEASFFAIMAVGMTLVIISGGIDLSVGSIYALSGVSAALILRALGPGAPAVPLAIGICLLTGLAAGLVNGALIVGLRVHPFIITLGMMWVFRGVAFVVSQADSLALPGSVVGLIKSNLGLAQPLRPVPLLIMLGVMALGAAYLSRTVMGRHIYAVGGNVEASRYAGLRVGRILLGVYAASGLTAGLAALVGSGYYGNATCNDGSGYELYAIASAVMGGVSLSGGRGSAFGAVLGAVLIVLIRQSINTLHLDANYEWIIIGSALIAAVVLDRLNAGLAARRLLADTRSA